MVKKYFPGANSGEGFYSRFGGIIPPNSPNHYTYILKGGPGVGKNTLMKKVAKRALQQGYKVEEFRCASDPKSLDALRIEKLGIVMLDGTAPHSIDPKVPGVCDEIIDLGKFKNQGDFVLYKRQLEDISEENKGYYRSAYAMLSAACILKKEAIDTAYKCINREKLRAFLSRVINAKKQGSARELFARSATPDGIIDFSPSFLPENTVRFAGIFGEVAMKEAKELIKGKECEVFYDFLTPDLPRCIVFGDSAIAVCDEGDTLATMCHTELPSHESFCIEKAEMLVKRATSLLAKALASHDKIEEIYRDFVDFDRVNEEGEKLLKRIGV